MQPNVHRNAFSNGPTQLIPEYLCVRYEELLANARQQPVGGRDFFLLSEKGAAQAMACR